MKIIKLISPPILILSTIILLTTCGDDGGGGGNGKPRGPKVPAQKLATRSLGQISAGGSLTCALTAEGKVLCWGNGGNGVLGNGTTADISRVDSSKPVVDNNGDTVSGIIQVSAGSTHICALSDAGRVLCWGKAQYGSLGNDCESTCTDKSHAVAVVDGDESTDPLTGIVQVSTGEEHTCAVTTEGEGFVLGFGGIQSTTGQWRNDVVDRTHPVGVVSSGESQRSFLLSGIVQISAGAFHTCALTVEGHSQMLGYGFNSGQSGQTTPTAHKNYPVDVVTLQNGSTDSLARTSFRSVHRDRYHTCAVTARGTRQVLGVQ